MSSETASAGAAEGDGVPTEACGAADCWAIAGAAHAKTIRQKTTVSR